MYADDAQRRRISKRMGMDYLRFGLFGQIVGLVVILDVPAPAGELVLVLSTGVLVGGCAKYARFHGLDRSWGLLGFLSVAGVLILMLLPLRAREKKRGAGFSVIFAEPYRRDVWRMDVRVMLDEKIGVHEPIMLQVARGSNIGSAMKTLAGAIPELGDGELRDASFIVNGRRADRRDELSDGDEVMVSVSGSVGASGVMGGTQLLDNHIRGT